jgi:hypothetical protein
VKSIGRRRMIDLDKWMTLEEIKEWQQYWWSRVCNSITIDKKQVYEELYNAYVKLEKLYIYER